MAREPSEVHRSDMGHMAHVPDEFTELEEATPLVQIEAPFGTRNKSIGLGLLLLALTSCVIFYSRTGSVETDFTGLELAELASCGRKLTWSAHPHMCAAAKGAYHGAEVTLELCGTLGFLDEWIFTKEGIVVRARLAAAPQFCLDVFTQKKPYPGAPLHVSECSDTAANRNQHFNLTKKGHVRSFDLCMDVQYGSSSPGAKLQLWHCLKGPQQHFNLMSCVESCFKQVQFHQTGQCLTTAGWHLKEGLPLILAGCMDTHVGASQFKFRNAGGRLQLALNEELCVETQGVGPTSKLLLAKCGVNNLFQEFVLDGALTFGSGTSCVVVAQNNQLQVSNKCDPQKTPEVGVFSTGCESLLHPVEAAEAPSQKGVGCPRQLKWATSPELCIGTMQWQVGNGQPLVLALCEDHGTDLPRQHWLITPGGKIVLASSPSYCIDVKDHSPKEGAELGISPCIAGDEGQTFSVEWDHRLRQGDRCVSVVDDIALPFSKLELRPCGENQQFIPDVCEHDEHAIPTDRKGSFLVVGDWGWDSLVHGNVPKAACQQEIGMLMTEKMEELGDVKFIINVGDSFYPDGLTSKSDPRWGEQWRERYPDRLRSVPWYSVYGNHDTHHDPGMCDPEAGSQINGNLHDLWTFYMPSYNWHIDHPELDLEVVGLDLNKFMDGWNKSAKVDELELSDCQYSKCPQTCVDNAEMRADGAFDLMTDRLNSSRRKNLVVFSHYPSDYFRSVPKFLNQLRHKKAGRTFAYFAGHRHNTDQTSTFRTGPHDWLVGGGGGWSCDGLEQGFVVVTIGKDFEFKTHPVLMNPYTCCPDLIHSAYRYKKK